MSIFQKLTLVYNNNFFFKNIEHANYLMCIFKKLLFSLYINTRILTLLIIEFNLLQNNTITISYCNKQNEYLILLNS